MIRRTLAVAALALAALAGPTAARAVAATPCELTAGTATANQAAACGVYGETVHDLTLQVWPRQQDASWNCAIDAPRQLTCRFVVVKRLGGLVTFDHTVTWRRLGGRCAKRVTTGDFTGRVPFGPSGCLTFHREDV